MKSERFCVIGNPIEHSLSPVIQNAALEARGLPYFYSRLFCENDESEFFKTLDNLKNNGYIGANITIPFKKLAYRYCNYHDEFSEICGASNVILWKDGVSYGFNTDANGFLISVKELLGRETLTDLNVAVLGACGGVGTTISHICSLCGANLTLVNRERQELYNLSEKLHAKAMTFSDNFYDVDLIVNATPLGLQDSNQLPIDFNLLKQSVTIFDCVPKDTQIIKESRRRNIVCCNGLNMLLWQGVLSFKKWFPDIDPPIEEMRNALKNYSLFQEHE